MQSLRAVRRCKRCFKLVPIIYMRNGLCLACYREVKEAKNKRVLEVVFWANRPQ